MTNKSELIIDSISRAGCEFQEVDEAFFMERIRYFEEKYRSVYKAGWGEFYGHHSKGETDDANLDYHEWAFLCEHFMQELVQFSPPKQASIKLREEPENSRALSFEVKAIVRPRGVRKTDEGRLEPVLSLWSRNY